MCTNLTDIPWPACQVTQQACATVSEFWSQQPLEFCHQEENQDIGELKLKIWEQEMKVRLNYKRMLSHVTAKVAVGWG